MKKRLMCRELIRFGETGASTLGFSILRSVAKACEDGEWWCDTNGDKSVSVIPTVRIHGVNIAVFVKNGAHIALADMYNSVTLKATVSHPAAFAHVVSELTKFRKLFVDILESERQSYATVQEIPKKRICGAYSHCRVDLQWDSDMGYYACYNHGLLEDGDIRFVADPFAV